MKHLFLKICILIVFQNMAMGQEIADLMKELYVKEPSLKTCECGELKEDIKQKALEYVNAVRALHGLEKVTYNHEKQKETQCAAFSIVANKNMTHYITPKARCYTIDAANGAMNSNLFWSSLYYPAHAFVLFLIEGWMDEKGSNSVGHRRWILDPFMKKIAFGVAADYQSRSAGASLYVVDRGRKSEKLKNQNLQFIAYPYKKYPAHLFPKDAYLSFSVIADKTSRFDDNREVDFSNAIISVLHQNEKYIVSDVSYDNEGAGVANSIQWKVEGLEEGKAYTVKIQNVKVKNETKNYQYQFTIDPNMRIKL
ncbi:CAP domain-containing protein [Capnocytophaga canis]|uniref:CAP domain-containing protein n=1 Tax=Capnocytophaga canis TaxID=1848903 RepID=UPI00156259E2|nr:CAP domain-containing protein [Capnocytophaga canis]